MTFKSGQQENTVAGCVQPDGLPRLLEIDGIHVEAPLEGNVIYLRNIDVPGVVGRVGTVLGKHNINIANFSLGEGSGPPVRPHLAQWGGDRSHQPLPWCKWMARLRRRRWNRCAVSRRFCKPRRSGSPRRKRSRRLARKLACCHGIPAQATAAWTVHPCVVEVGL